MGNLNADFCGDVAVVTGAAGGIGLEIALELARAGATVHGFDVRAPEPESLSLPDGVAPPRYTQVDIRSTADVEGAVAGVLRAEGKIDLLVNNAGITRDRTLWKLAEEDWRAVLDVNLTGSWNVLRAVAPGMRERGRGRIVQISSVNGLRGKFGQTNYAASKAGVIGLTRAAARELGPRGITVNAVAPGMIETSMSASLPEEVLSRAIGESCLGALGRPGDVAAAVLFLLSDQAAHVTGVVLPVDGGQLA